MQSSRDTSKRAISRADKLALKPAKQGCNSISERNATKKRTLSVYAKRTQHEQASKEVLSQCQRPECIELGASIESLLSAVSKLKPCLSLKSVPNKQTYRQFQIVRKALTSKLKRGGRRHRISEEYQLKDQPNLNSQRTITQLFQQVSKYRHVIEQLGLELRGMEALYQESVEREGFLGECNQLQQQEMGKYKELLRYKTRSTKLLDYFTMINQYKEARIERGGSLVMLESGIRQLESLLRLELDQQASIQCDLASKCKASDEKLNELAELLQQAESNLNSTNQEHIRVQGSLEGSSKQMSTLLSLLQLEESPNFFDNFSTLAVRIVEITSLIPNSRCSILQSKLSALQGFAKETTHYQQELHQWGRTITPKQKDFPRADPREFLSPKDCNRNTTWASSFDISSSNMDMIKNNLSAVSKDLERIVSMSENQSQEESDLQEKDCQCAGVIQELKGHENEIKGRINAFRDYFLATNQSHDQLSLELRAKTSKNQQLQNQMDAKGRAYSNSQTYMSKLKESLQDKNAQIQTLTWKLNNQYHLHQSHLPSVERAQLLSHIEAQQAQINRLSSALVLSGQTLLSLEHKVSLSSQELEQWQSILLVERQSYTKLKEKSTHMISLLSQQQLEIQILTRKLQTKCSETDCVLEQMEGLRQQMTTLRQDCQLKEAQSARCMVLMNDIQFQSIRASKERKKMQFSVRQKDSIITDNYLQISILKKKIEEYQDIWKIQLIASKKTLFEDLHSLVGDFSQCAQEPFQVLGLAIRVPILEFIEMHPSSDGISLTQSREVSIQVESQSFQGRSSKEQNVLKELSDGQITSNKRFQRFLCNFGSDRRIQQIKTLVDSELQTETVDVQHLQHSGRRISNIASHGHDGILGRDNQDLQCLL